MAKALKYAAVWIPLCTFLSVAAVACGDYHTELEKLQHEEWLIKQKMCEKRGGLMERSWGNDTCEERK